MGNKKFKYPNLQPPRPHGAMVIPVHATLVLRDNLASNSSSAANGTNTTTENVAESLKGMQVVRQGVALQVPMPEGKN